MPVKIAMLGASHPHSHGNAKAASMVDEVELVGVWDQDAQLAWRRGTEWAEFQPDLTVFSAAEDLLSDPSIPGVVVDGSVQDNIALARKALEAGKHVLLEKPGGVEAGQLEGVQALAAEKGLLLQMGYIMRYNAGFELIKRLMAAGALGDVFFVRGRISWERSSYDDQMPKISPFRGGMLFELGCHYLDMITILLGTPAQAHAHFGRHHDPARRYTDSALGYLEYDNAFATIETCAMESGALQNRCFEVYGTAGTVIVQPLEPPEVVVHLDQSWGDFRSGWQSAHIERLPRHVKDLREFAACIRGEKEPNYSPEHDLLVQNTLLSMCATDQ